MIYTYSNVADYTAAGNTLALQQGIPSGEKWRLLEVKLPCDVLAECRVNIFVDGMQRFQLVPSLNDNVLVIDEEFNEGASIDCYVEKLDAVAQVVGVTLVVDRYSK